MAKKRGQLRFCCDFRCLNAVTKKRCVPRSDLRSWKNANNGPPRGWTGSLDELPSSRESG